MKANFPESKPSCANKTSPAHISGSWRALPQRLRERGDFLLKQSKIKDAELMYDAALEIEAMRSRAKC